MAVSWYCTDGDYTVTPGVTSVRFASVIQNPDAYGGYNVCFSTSGLEQYHVHFYAGGTRVSVIRYKSGPSAEGINIMKCNGKDKPTFGDLAYECGGFYPNVKKLMDNFKTAIAGVKRNRRNELEN